MCSKASGDDSDSNEEALLESMFIQSPGMSPSTLTSATQPRFSSTTETSSCDIRKYIPSTQLSSSVGSSIMHDSTTVSLEESPCTSVSAMRCKSGSNGTAAIPQLQYISEMFPCLDHETISKTLSNSNMCLEVAIDTLLGVTGKIKQCD